LTISHGSWLWIPGLAAARRPGMTALLRHHGISESSNPGNLDLAHIARLDVRRHAVGAHPHHIAGHDGTVFADLRNVRRRIEDHVVGLEPLPDLTVDPDGGVHRIEIGADRDPRAHRLECVTILCAPLRAVVRLPAALAHVVADGPAEYMIERLCP